MINSAATAAQYSAAGKNCYNVSYVQYDGKKRDLESSFPMSSASAAASLSNSICMSAIEGLSQESSTMTHTGGISQLQGQAIISMSNSPSRWALGDNSSMTLSKR